MLQHCYLTLLLVPFVFSFFIISCNHKPRLYLFISQLQLIILPILYVVSLFTNAAHHLATFDFVSLFGLNFQVRLGFDILSQVMSAVIIIIATCTVAYSQRYLSSDTTQARFLAQINFVISSVLMLVMAANLFTAFLAWQFIGLSLYVLLNHYHYDLKANKAAKKKFVINRIGDLCFLIAVILVYKEQSTSSFASLAVLSHSKLITLLIFIAIMTKSAQVPFHIWLPDTLETPTPVSALMHAGVINAGGFLLIRCSPLFLQHKSILGLVLFVGALTAIVGGVCAIWQTSVKKQLAYSTMSQMGYMVFQCGTGLFIAALFHLIAHGFLKGFSFLNSGAMLFKEPAQPKPKLVPAIFGLIVAALLLFVAISLAQYLSFAVPILFWGFIFITISSLLFNLYLKNIGFVVKAINTFLIWVALLVYILLLQKLTSLIGFDNFWLKSNLLQSGICVLLIVVQIARWFLGDRAYINKMHYQFVIEKIYRSILLNPLRSVGNALNVRLNTFKRGRFEAVIFVLMILVFILTLILNAHLNPALNWLLQIIQVGLLLLAIVAGVIANRATKILGISFWVLLIQLTVLTFILLHKMPLIGLFYAINLGFVFIVLFYLFSSSKNTTSYNQQQTNTLSAPMFYFSCSLLCLIGMPGTASFIGELYLFHVLIQTNLLLVIMYALLMLMIAIVIMHTLQLYVFRISNTSALNLHLSKVQHFVFIILLSANIFSGCFPDLVLTFLQRLL